MKIIIISNRKYRYIYEKLMELEKHLKATGAGSEPAPEENSKRNAEIINDTGEVYTDGEKVCELLCISDRTLLRLCKQHQINSKRVAHRCYYPLSEIEKLFVSRSIGFDRVVRGRLRQELKRLKEQNNNENTENHELH